MLFSCAIAKKTITLPNNDMSYLIKKIDKKHSWYIIYAERNDTLFKIVSHAEKNTRHNYTKIAVGKSYNFELKSKRENIPIINGVLLRPVNYLHIANATSYESNGCECYIYYKKLYIFNKKLVICTDPERGIYDLYYSDNLKGIYVSYQ